MRRWLQQAVGSTPLDDESINRILNFARRHLGMDMAWISHVADGAQIVEALDGGGRDFGVVVGAANACDLGARVASGQLPPVVADTRTDPRTSQARAACAIDVGAYVTVPLRLPDGQLYGMLSCARAEPDPGLQDRDAEFLRLIADLLAPSITEQDHQRRYRADTTTRVQALLAKGGPAILVQPIQQLPTRRTVAYEALARFPAGHGGPEQWFADAANAGLGVELELAAVVNALRLLSRIPRHVALAVNVSPEAFLDPELQSAVLGGSAERVIVEITEHSRVEDYRALTAAAVRLRAAGARVAADDAGSGYAGFQHLIELRPDIIKLDRQIVHHIDTDPARAAMAAALRHFAHATGATVLAEGIETRSELTTAADLGITLAQGYHIGRPRTLATTRAASARSHAA